jgi:hypothetical protein
VVSLAAKVSDEATMLRAAKMLAVAENEAAIIEIATSLAEDRSLLPMVRVLCLGLLTSESRDAARAAVAEVACRLGEVDSAIEFIIGITDVDARGRSVVKCAKVAAVASGPGDIRRLILTAESYANRIAAATVAAETAASKGRLELAMSLLVAARQDVRSPMDLELLEASVVRVAVSAGKRGWDSGSVQELVRILEGRGGSHPRIGQVSLAISTDSANLNDDVPEDPEDPEDAGQDVDVFDPLAGVTDSPLLPWTGVDLAEGVPPELGMVMRAAVRVGNKRLARAAALAAPDRLGRATSQRVLVDMLIANDDLEGAIDIGTAIGFVNIQAEALAHVVAASLRRGLFDVALAAARAIHNSGERVRSLYTVARSAAAVSRFEFALAAADDMTMSASRVEAIGEVLLVACGDLGSLRSDEAVGRIFHTFSDVVRSSLVDGSLARLILRSASSSDLAPARLFLLLCRTNLSIDTCLAGLSLNPDAALGLIHELAGAAA